MSDNTRIDGKHRDDDAAPGTPRLDRASLLALTGAATAGALALPQLAFGESTRSAVSPSTNRGPAKTIAVGFIYGANPSVTDIFVGLRNAAELVGWKTKLFVSYANAESALTLEKEIEQAITVKPDVLITGMWYPNAQPLMLKARKQGIYVMAANVADPATVTKLGIPFAGQDFVAAGETLGQAIAGELLKRGKKDGVILSGNGAPGALPIEQRIQGIKQGTQKFNKANGTNFSNDTLNDQSPVDLGKSVLLYKTKLTQLGKKFVAFAGTGTETGTANIKVAQTLGWKPGQYIIGTFDTGPSINPAIRSGLVQFAMDQQFFLSGLMSGFHAWLAVNRMFTPLTVYNTGSAYVTPKTIGQVDTRDAAVAQLRKAYGFKV
jgi:ABC-type sugar transport system substrate-binding protein